MSASARLPSSVLRHVACLLAYILLKGRQVELALSLHDQLSRLALGLIRFRFVTIAKINHPYPFATTTAEVAYYY
jgi:hypothetical protein